MTAAQQMRHAITIVENADLPVIRISHIINAEAGKLQHLEEGKWISGRFPDNIRIDRATYMRQGHRHAHVFGRNGDDLIMVVTDAGKGSHGTKGRLHAEDADALRREDFDIPANNIIEWILVTDDGLRQILLG